MSLVKNLGREEITTASYLSKKFEIARLVSNFNLPGKSRKNVNITMTLEVKKVKSYMIYFLIKT